MSSNNGLVLNRGGGGEKPQIDSGGHWAAPFAIMTPGQVAGTAQVQVMAGVSARVAIATSMMAALVAADACESPDDAAKKGLEHADALIARLKAERAGA